MVDVSWKSQYGLLEFLQGSSPVGLTNCILGTILYIYMWIKSIEFPRARIRDIETMFIIRPIIVPMSTDCSLPLLSPCVLRASVRTVNFQNWKRWSIGSPPIADRITKMRILICNSVSSTKWSVFLLFLSTRLYFLLQIFHLSTSISDQTKSRSLQCILRYSILSIWIWRYTNQRLVWYCQASPCTHLLYKLLQFLIRPKFVHKNNIFSPGVFLGMMNQRPLNRTAYAVMNYGMLYARFIWKSFFVSSN